MQLSIDGDPVLADSDVWLDPGDTLSLGVYGTTHAYEYLYWLVAVHSAEGHLTRGVAVQGSGSEIIYYTYWPLYYAGLNGQYYQAAGWIVDDGDLSGLLVDSIDFNITGPGDAAIYLYTSPDGSDWAMVDNLTVHVPEPVSISLLAVCGLLLRRHK